jgi:hypothetical protein
LGSRIASKNPFHGLDYKTIPPDGLECQMEHSSIEWVEVNARLALPILVGFAGVF